MIPTRVAWCRVREIGRPAIRGRPAKQRGVRVRVSILGQAAFGEAVLKRLQQDGLDVVAVSAPQPMATGRADALWAAAVAAGLPVVDTAALKTDAGLADWKSIGADLGVMAFVTEILPADALDAPRLGTIQYHPSLLPLHRGSSAINWPIIFGRAETGLTVFWPDKGVDTGPILLQQRCAIGPDDTVGSLYFDQLFPMGIDALSQAVQLVAQGRAPRLEQDHALATYEPPCSERHAAIPWHAPADRVYALIRGCNPQPGAWATYEGTKLSIFDARLTGDQEPGMPGRVLRVNDDSFDVRLNGGVLRVLRVQPAGSKKMPASEWASTVGLSAGARFR
jgi:methionyl-tRNA formyltransferase